MSEISIRRAVGCSCRRMAEGVMHLQAAGWGQGPVTEENWQPGHPPAAELRGPCFLPDPRSPSPVTSEA